MIPTWLPYAITWVLSTLLGAAAAYAALRSKLTDLDVRLRTVEGEIGTHESGLRGRSHEHNSALLRLDGRVTALEDRHG
jgi:hypothetical protein